jgi:hypothetical protein
MATQINARLRALRLRPTVKYHPANPRDGLASRQARLPSLSAADHDNIKWARERFKFDVIDGIHVAKLEANVDAARASFFSAAAVPMRMSKSPLCILNNGVLNSHFTMPVYVVQDPRWYHGNFNSSVMSTTRYPAFDSASKTLSIDAHRRSAGCSAVEIMEVYVAVLWQTLEDTLQDRSSADTAVLVTRSAQICLQEYSNTHRLESLVSKATSASHLRNLLEKRDSSCENACDLTKYISTLHPSDYYEAMLQNFDFFDSSSMPAIFHLFLGLITKPDKVSIYGLREIVLEACIERCAKHIGAVRLTGASRRDIDSCYNTIVNRAAEVLVPVLRKWSFVLDCLTLFCSNSFLQTPAQQIAKQIAAYADYAQTHVKDGNLRVAMEAVYPGIARISNADVVEMLMRAAECSRKTRFNTTELFQGVPGGRVTRFDKQLEKANEYDEIVRHAAVQFVMDMKTQNETARVPLCGRPHFFSGKHAIDTATLTLNHFAKRGNKQMFDLTRAKTPYPCREGRRFRAIWDYYNDGKRKDSTQMNSLIRRLGDLPIDDDEDDHSHHRSATPKSPKTSISLEDDEKKDEDVSRDWLKLMDPFIENKEQRDQAREILFALEHECCVCLNEQCKLVSCCILSSKHMVCVTCLPTILAGRVCPLCRAATN